MSPNWTSSAWMSKSPCSGNRPRLLTVNIQRLASRWETATPKKASNVTLLQVCCLGCRCSYPCIRKALHWAARYWIQNWPDAPRRTAPKVRFHDDWIQDSRATIENNLNRKLRPRDFGSFLTSWWDTPDPWRNTEQIDDDLERWLDGKWSVGVDPASYLRGPTTAVGQRARRWCCRTSFKPKRKWLAVNDKLQCLFPWSQLLVSPLLFVIKKCIYRNRGQDIPQLDCFRHRYTIFCEFFFVSKEKATSTSKCSCASWKRCATFQSEKYLTSVGVWPHHAIWQPDVQQATLEKIKKLKTRFVVSKTQRFCRSIQCVKTTSIKQRLWRAVDEILIIIPLLGIWYCCAGARLIGHWSIEWRCGEACLPRYWILEETASQTTEDRHEDGPRKGGWRYGTNKT